MINALYYPHTTIQNEDTLKQGLLFWDSIETIVPQSNHPLPQGMSPLVRRAHEVLVREHLPSHGEQLKAHKAIADVVARGLPHWVFGGPFNPRRRNDWPQHLIYPQKFLMETWHLLGQKNLSSLDRASRDYQVPRPVGLLLMSVLAEQCAGGTRERITDRTDAYAWLTRWLLARLGGTALTPHNKISAGSARRRLATISLDLVSSKPISLKRLVEVREEEARRPGRGLREFRAKYREAVDTYVARLTTEARGDADVATILAEFKASMRSDVANLRSELSLEKGKLLFNEKVLVAALIGASVFVPALPALLAAKAAVAAFGALGTAAVVRSALEFEGGKRSALSRHSMSWLYLTAS